MKELSITVRETAGLGTLRPVTGGVPIAEGAAPEGVAFRLLAEDKNSVPLQTSVLGRWKDGSARWVLLDFQCKPQPGGERVYTLAWGEDSGPSEPAQSDAPEVVVCQTADDRPGLASCNVTVSLAEGALLRISDCLDVAFSLTDAEGQVCEAVVEAAEVETAGKLRSTLSVVGAFRTPAGGRVFQFRLRASVYAGLSLIRLEPLIVVDADEGILQRIRELKLTLGPRNPAGSVRIGGEPGWNGKAEAGEVRLLQTDDQHYRFEGAEGAGGQAPGWAELSDGDGKGMLAMALRAFWAQWPKSIEASPKGLSIGLFPRFREGDFAHMEPWYKHQYLFGGDCYRLRTGQARRWDIWLDLAGDGASVAKAADAPLVPAADPAQAIATGVWGAIAPAGTPAMAAYDPWADKLFEAYCRSIETQRDYGAMNWGDWFGERYVNWGNHEYDTTRQILMQFARTGDPKYFYVADAAAHHSAEVDTIHHVNADLANYFSDHWSRKGFPPRKGMVHEHTVGHVSGFYSPETIRELFVEKGVGSSKNPYLCMDPFNLGHLWTQGTARHYFLTGDPFLKETVALIADNLAQLVEDGEYDFAIGDAHCGRTFGWPLLALAGAYDIGLNERYLNAMKALADRILPRQDPVCGGWLYKLYPGHCLCTTQKHVGMAGFITSVLINGLSEYYLMTGDERLRDALDRAVTFLDNDTWREGWRDWRYTSCPASSKMNQPGVTILAHVNGVRIAGNPEHLRVLRVAWDAKFKRLLEEPESVGMGKTFTFTMLGCAEAIGLLAKETEKA